MQAAFLQFSFNFCFYFQYITRGGGGQANFTGKCINFLNGAASPARNGAPANCAGAASAAGERPAGRFSSVSPPEGKRPFTAPAPRAAGPRPGICQRPPRARSRARAGGADDLHQPEPGATAGQHRAPGQHRPCSRGRVAEGSCRVGVRGGRPLGGHSMPRIP